MKNLKILHIACLTFFSWLFIATSAMAATTTPVEVNPDCNNPSASGLTNCLQHNKIIVDLNYIIDFLSAGVGIVVVGSIILGGVQYAMAGSSPDAVGKAKQRITNGFIALVVFIFIFAFLQWLIPGGL